MNAARLDLILILNKPPPPIDTFVTATTPSYESEVVAMFNKYKPLDDVIRVGGLL